MTSTDGFSRGPFRSARRDIRDFVAIPIQAWTILPPARRTDAAYRPLLEIPVDLASAGFRVTVSANDDRWQIELAKEIADGFTLRLSGEARSYASALFQIAQAYDIAIDDLQRAARKAWEAGAVDDETARPTVKKPARREAAARTPTTMPPEPVSAPMIDPETRAQAQIAVRFRGDAAS